MKAEDSDLLTRVGPGTAMNAYMRSHWIPAVRSASVEPGGAPIRVRLLGENYVAFRNADGDIGFLDEACPHRGVSLALGRNEACGLRCIYHGWQFDVSGRCVDIPNEYDDRKDAVAKSIKVRHFPHAEKGGLLWVYLGEGDAPAFPNFEWLRDGVALPPRGAILHCNWLQTMEGNLDPDHVGQLHRSWFGDLAKKAFSVRPAYEVVKRPWGFAGAATRDFGPFSYHRVKEMALPWYMHVPFDAGQPRSCLVSVPIDDETTYVWYLAGGLSEFENGEIATSEQLVGQPEGGDRWQYMVDSRLDAPPDPDNFRRTLPHRPEALWDQNRAKMQEGHFTGLPGFVMEDFAVFESMGAISDRSKEHLVISDQFIMRLRRELLDEVRNFAKSGKRADVDYSDVYAIAATLPSDQTWKDIEKPDLYADEASGVRQALEAGDGEGEPWELLIDTPMGQQKLALRIWVKGEALGGSLTSDGDVAPLTDGVAHGPALRWKARVKRPMPMDIAFDVTVEGNALKGTFKPGAFPSGAVTGRRLAGLVDA